MALTVSRKVRIAIGAPLAVVVLVAGFLLLHGDFARWSDNSALDEACDGLLDRGAVRDVLGGGEVAVDALGGALAHCRVTVAGGGNAEIEVVDTAAGLRSADGLPMVGGGGLPAPVGHGWTGHFDAEFDPSRPETGGGVTGSVLLVLSCARTSGTDGLAVRVHSELEGDLDDPANRPRYARIATSTAAKADRARHCAARLGRPVDALGLPVTEDQYQPLATADGTCAGLPATRGMTVGTGTARGGAPTETCRLGTAGTRRADLTALFGPYAEEERLRSADGYHGEGPTRDRPVHLRAADGRVSWTTADCPDGPAVFTAVPAVTGDSRRPPAGAADRAAERTVLSAFAARSARAHGCSAPRPLPDR